MAKRRREEKERRKERSGAGSSSRMKFGRGTHIEGNVAGRDIHYHQQSVLRTIAIVFGVLWIAAAGGLVAGAILNDHRSDQQANAADAIRGEAPQVAVRTLDHSGGGTHWVTTRPPHDLEKYLDVEFPDTLLWHDWEPVKDGAMAPGYQAELTIQGVNQAQVVLTDMKVRVLARRPPIAGTELKTPTGGGGQFRYLEVDFDALVPTAKPVVKTGGALAAPDKAWETTPVVFPYEVSISDAETFVISATTEKYDVDWVVDLSWAASGKTGTMLIDNRGKPFRTSSVSAAQRCTLNGSSLACS